MFGKTTLRIDGAKLQQLKHQYRLEHLSNRDAVQIILDKLIADPGFHRVFLSENRTDS